MDLWFREDLIGQLEVALLILTFYLSMIAYILLSSNMVLCPQLGFYHGLYTVCSPDLDNL